MSTPRLRALFRYPVKSLAGAARSQAEVEPWGLAGDRRWMLTTPEGVQVTQREHPRLALASAVALPGGRVRLSAPAREPLEVAVPAAGRATGEATGQAAGEAADTTVVVRVFGTKVEAVPAAAEASAWLTDYLGAHVELVYMDAPERSRLIDRAYAEEGPTVSFADSMPLLVTTASSLDALNSLIAQGSHADEGPLPMNRFRPSLVVEGTEPWAEDTWRRVRIGEVTCAVSKACGRCVITTTDQATAERGREPLRTLARHRRSENGRLIFGQYLIPEHTGRVRSGDPFEVLESGASA